MNPEAQHHLPSPESSKPATPEEEPTEVLPAENLKERSDMGVYLDAIGQFPLLSAEEEVELAKQIEAGLFAAHILAAEEEDIGVPEGLRAELNCLVQEGIKAKETFINSNLRLVLKFARPQAARWGLPLLDVIQHGNPGLIRAVEKFDYTKGYKFSTYAAPWIRESIYRAIERDTSVILGGTTLQDIRYMRRLEKEGIADDKIAEKMEVKLARVKELRDVDNTMSQLVRGNRVIDEESEAELFDFIPDNSDPVESLLLELSRSTALRAALAQLDKEAAQVLVYKYGLGENRPMTWAEVSEKMGIHADTLRRRHKIALQQLRESLDEQDLY